MGIEQSLKINYNSTVVIYMAQNGLLLRMCRLTQTNSLSLTLQSSSERHLCHDDQVTRAEIVMLFRLVKHNYSFSSYDDLTEILKYVFDKDDVVRDMSLGHSMPNGTILRKVPG